MLPKKKKTPQEKVVENFFPINKEDYKNTTEKSVKEFIQEKPTSSVEIKVSKKPFIKESLKYAIEKPYHKTNRTSLETIEKSANIIKEKKNKKPLKKKTPQKIEFIPQKTKLKQDGYELIITEKPQAALKIASALGKPIKRDNNKIPYYELTRDNNKIIVACAVGHLFTLKQNFPGSKVPVFDISWTPNYLARKKDFTKKYFDTISKLSKNAGSITVATDFDVEGEVIGLNIVRYICGQDNAKRMKFSTLTKDELNSSYENKLPHLEWGQAIAGETRHYLDWFYGINLSRALMNSIKTTGKFRIMSIGRVQGPALKLIVDKEREIQKFKSEIYYQVFIKIKDNKTSIELKYNKDIFDKKELEKFKNIIGKRVQVETKKITQILPPNPPFNLTELQKEAYKFHGITPTKTLAAAQSLYLSGLISYPRTSSQKLPASVDYKSILKKISKIYNAESLIKRDIPVEGKKTDPAHPSIYPTGQEQEKTLSGDEEKIYNLIVRRFISLFCEDAILENKTIKAVLNDLIFSTKGSTISKKAWMQIYPTKIKQEKIPDMNGEAEIVDSRIEEKETQPPKRFSPASILSELEKRNLGTKCLTGDTKIIFNGELIKIEELFNSGRVYTKKDDVEIKEINGKVISFLEKEKSSIITSPSFISKRKIKENEEVIQIETDSSIISLTGEHLIYVLRNNEIQQIKSKELKLNDNILGVIKNLKYGKIITNQPIFDKNFKEIKDEILHKFSQKNSKGIKRDCLPLKWSDSLAWLLGYYYGDGSYSNPKYNGSHQVCFTTTEKKALSLLKEKIKNLFGIEPYSYNLGNEYKINCNSVMSYFLAKCFPEIEGKNPLSIPHMFIGSFLRGFFDADGNVHLRPKKITKIKGIECNSFDTPRVKITLASKKLIKWISRMLKELRIDNKINKNVSACNGKKFDCWTILISGRDKIEKFAYKIGFSNYKEYLLYKGLRCNSWKYKVLKNSAKICLILNKKPLKIEELEKESLIQKYELRVALKRLSKLGIINKKRYTNRNKNIYFLTDKSIEFINHCMKLLYEKNIFGTYNIPINKISKKQYSGYVYDISIEKNSPNFITEGNLLIHNSTRAAILETLYDRGYVVDSSIKATPLGISLISTLEKYSPIIIDEELTREFEKNMENLEASKESGLEKQEGKIIEKAKEKIIIISKDFEKNEAQIGQELMDANTRLREEQKIANKLILCPKCQKGHLAINYSKKTRRAFVACDAYPECRNTYNLPPDRAIKKTDKICEECQYPMLMALKSGKKPWLFCFNPKCPTNIKRLEEYRAKQEGKDNSQEVII